MIIIISLLFAIITWVLSGLYFWMNRDLNRLKMRIFELEQLVQEHEEEIRKIEKDLNALIQETRSLEEKTAKDISELEDLRSFVVSWFVLLDIHKKLKKYETKK